jgi:hypothetical protein
MARRRRYVEWFCLLIGGVGFAALQVVFLAHFLQSEDAAKLFILNEPQTVSSQELERVPHLTAQPAAADEEDESDSRAPSRHKHVIQSMADFKAAVAQHSASVAASRRSTAVFGSSEAAGPASSGSLAVALHGCVGKGTYGYVLDGSMGTRRVAVKVPILRRWDLKYFTKEVQALNAIQSLTGGSRHVVRLLSGNFSVDAAKLLRRSGTSEGVETIGNWSCVNQTDLHDARYTRGLTALPALLLESVSIDGAGVSVFSWLASVAAPLDASSMEAQRRLFRAQLTRTRASSQLMQAAFGHAATVLLGVARGLSVLHKARVVHRDLTEPGKNALLKRDEIGLTAAIIDFSQAERCPTGHGATARAVDMYGFGNMLYFACYGRVARSLPWTQYSCSGTSASGLRDLAMRHASIHPNRQAAHPSLFNRCHHRVAPLLDDLMIYSWAPALAAAAAVGSSTAADGELGTGTAVNRLNHTWEEILQKLEAVREERRSIFHFV